MAENIINNEVLNHDGATSVTNWISQINAGGTVYDIATHHGIKFFDGKGDTTGTTWNGLTDLEIVIPNITDIVQTPIEFAGTVADGKVTWNSTHADGPQNGYLVFVTADCTFDDKACEAGDMAIYNDGVWNVVSGENQVELKGKTDADNRITVAVGAAKDVLVVEGKALSLTLDYADLNENHVDKTYGGNVPVNFDNITVGEKYLKLSQGASTQVSIIDTVTFDRATALADGVVKFTGADNLINGVTFGTFDAGAFPTLNKNGQTTFTVDGGSLSKVAGSDFVEDVAINDITFVKAGENDQNKIVMLTDLTAGAGSEFFSGVHVTDSTKNEVADFTIKGYVAPTKNGVQFVEGLEGTDKPVVGIETKGSVTLKTGASEVATGFGEAGSAGDVLAGVTVTTSTKDVFNSATVTNHVLSFGSVPVTDTVNVDKTYKSLVKSAIEYTDPTLKFGTFAKSGFETVADVNYTFDRTKETTYTAGTAEWKLNTPALTVNKKSYTFVDDGMKATVPADTFVTSQTAGTLPSLTNGSVSKANVSATVDTKLTFVDQSINAVIAGTKIDLPGAYTLVEGAENDGVSVGKAGEVSGKSASVKLEGYLKDVNVVKVKTQE